MGAGRRARIGLERRLDVGDRGEQRERQAASAAPPGRMPGGTRSGIGHGPKTTSGGRVAAARLPCPRSPGRRSRRRRPRRSQRSRRTIDPRPHRAEPDRTRAVLRASSRGPSLGAGRDREDVREVDQPEGLPDGAHPVALVLDLGDGAPEVPGAEQQLPDPVEILEPGSRSAPRRRSARGRARRPCPAGASRGAASPSRGTGGCGRAPSAA